MLIPRDDMKIFVALNPEPAAKEKAQQVIHKLREMKLPRAADYVESSIQ